VILPRDGGLSLVQTWQDAQVIAVIMPNDAGIRNVAWQTYATTVDAVEALSGYDLLALLRDDVELALESGTQPPSAAVDGPYAGFALDPITMSAAGSSDGDGDALTYAWDLGDGTQATGAQVTHAYAAPGTYTVRVIVTDALGLADTVSTSATMSLLPADKGLERLYRMLDDLMGSGVFRGGEANGLRSTLDAAGKQLARSHGTPMRGQLGALRNQLQAMVRSGRLTAAQAAPMLEMIERVLAALP
jgi:tape measure domain-containing protein